jgi:hypothetical protein
MTSWGKALALGACMAATPAAAQLVRVDSGSTATLQLRPGFAPNPSGQEDLAGMAIAAARAEPNPAFPGELAGAAFDAETIIAPGGITFQNASFAAGGFSGAVARTTLDILFANPLAMPAETRLVSLIVPAAFGFYVTQPGCDPLLLTACPSGGRPAGFASFSRDRQAPGGELLATAGFRFSILSDGVLVDEIAGSASLVRAAGTGQIGIVEDFGPGIGLLRNFGLLTPVGSADRAVWGWDETLFELLFPATQALLGPGETRTVSYRLETFAATRAFFDTANVAGPNADGLIAFSAFGDPCCRGGGDEPIASLSITPLRFALPELVLEPGGPPRIDVYLGRPAPQAAIPEPTAWAMLLAGFGICGAALRRRPPRPGVSA